MKEFEYVGGPFDGEKFEIEYQPEMGEQIGRSERVDGGFNMHGYQFNKFCVEYIGYEFYTDKQVGGIK